MAVLENCTKSKYNYAAKDLEYQSRLKHLKLPRLGYRGKKLICYKYSGIVKGLICRTEISSS